MPDFEAIHAIIIGLVIGAIVSLIFAIYKIPSWTDFLIPTVTAIGNAMPNQSAQTQAISENLIMAIKFAGWVSAIDGPLSVLGLILAFYEKRQQ